MRPTCIFLLLCTLLLALPVSAAVESFTLDGPSEIPIFACSHGDFSFAVKNTGETASRYQFAIAGKGASFVTGFGAPSDLMLQPGEQRMVPVYLGVPCQAKGSQELQIMVTAASEMQHVLHVAITGVPAENAQLTLIRANETITPCGFARYAATLTNTHNFTESFTLDVQGAIEETRLGPLETVLTPGASEEIVVEIEPQDCTRMGVMDITLTATGRYSGYEGHLALPLSIKADGLAQIIAPSNITRPGLPATLKFMVRNIGDASATFDVAVEGVDNAEVVPSRVLINGNDTASMTLTISEGNDTTLGVVPLTIIVRSDSYPGEFTHDISLELKRSPPLRTLAILFGILIGLLMALLIFLAIREREEYLTFQRKLRDSMQQLWGKSAVKARALRRQRQRERAARIKERMHARRLKQVSQLRRELKRELRREYKLISRRMPRHRNYGWLKRLLAWFMGVAIMAGAGIGIYYWFIHRADVGRWFNVKWAWVLGTLGSTGDAVIMNGTYILYGVGAIVALFIIAWMAGKIRIRMRYPAEKDEKDPAMHSSGLGGAWLLSGIFAAIGVATAAFHFRDILPYYREQIHLSLAVIAVFLVLLFFSRHRTRHVRLRRASAGEPHNIRLGWAAGVGELAFTLKEQYDRRAFRISKGRRERAYTAPGQHIFQYFHVNDTSGATSFGSCSLRFSIPHNWLAKMGISPADVRLVHLENGIWKRMPTQILERNDKRAYFQAGTTSLPGQYAIVGRSTRKPVRRLPWAAFAVGALLVIAAVLVSLQAPEQDTLPMLGIPEQVWEAGTAHKLNLSLYFSDPDGDGLTFFAEGYEHIRIDLQESVAILIPPDGWSGSDFVTFTAKDGKGGAAKSNLVHLRVKKPLIPNYLVPPARYLVAFGFILFLFAMFYTFRQQIMLVTGKK